MTSILDRIAPTMGRVVTASADFIEAAGDLARSRRGRSGIEERLLVSRRDELRAEMGLALKRAGLTKLPLAIVEGLLKERRTYRRQRAAEAAARRRNYQPKAA